ncbi:MAG: response regulator [Desulfamplus sp.]|nr:response regulator [Desulfamplus sp.]
MDFINNITIKSRMVLSFVLVLIFFIAFSMYTISQMNELGELTSNLYEYPLQVTNAAQKANTGVIRMHRSMKDVSMSTTEMDLHQAILTVQEEEKRVYQNLEIVKSRILGEEGKALAKETIDLFAGWKPIRDEVAQLTMQGDREAAGRITREKGADYVFNLERKMMELTAYAINKADGFMEDARAVQQHILWSRIIFIVAAILLLLLITTLITKSILTSVSGLKDTMSKVTETGTLIKSELAGKNEISDMAQHFNRLIDKLQDQFWLKDGQASLNEEMSGELTYEELVTKIINFISCHVGACAGALYAYDNKRSVCELKASYAFVEGKHLSSEFGLGEGIVGQVAVEKKPILLKNITREDTLVKSGTVSEPPRNIYAFPLVYEKELLGILEVATFEEINPLKVEFLKMAAPIISTTLYTALQGKQIQTLLESTQKANEELQAQSEELQQTSEELQQQNVELEQQRLAVEGASRMKSQFLSNMSHELRTPLNSVMALSRVLIMQAKAKLSPEEGNYPEIIERNGKNLLALINDILDLSKIEAGRMDVNPQPFSLAMTLENIVESITPIAAEKQIKIHQEIPEDLPLLESDEIRVSQILQNLIGNGVKFTDTGNVTASVQSDKEKIAVRITDTGIGIAENDLPYIFDEFRQVDGSSSRRHEGTGLGLAIARKAARMLGGDITVTSTPGKGSTFTLTLPIVWQGLAPVYEPIVSREPSTVKPAHKTILVVDDEPAMGSMISRYLLQEGYNTLTATSGSEALQLAARERPFAITLDIIMPDMDGWEVLQQLKKNPETCDIPTIIVSVSEEKETGFALGAVGYVSKPVSRKQLISEIQKIGKPQARSIMIVDDNDLDRQNIRQIIEAEGLDSIEAEDGAACLELIKKQVPDVLVLDLMMPEPDGFTVLKEIRSNPATRDLPVIVVTAKDLTTEDRNKLTGNVFSVLEKTDASSATLLAEIKRILRDLEEDPKHSGGNQPTVPPRILIVDDNETVIIQVKSVLESAGYIADVARGGQEALDYVSHTIPDGIILDLMMPEIDGLAVLEKIRGTKATVKIPVLILTAKDLTPEDYKKLSANNIQQLVQKGDIDLDSLLSMVRSMTEKKAQITFETETLKPKTPTHKPVTSQLESTPIQKPGGEKATILVVEDNPDNMTTIKAVLKNRYRILEATDGEAGLQMAEEAKPDLILLDMALPKMDGFSVVRNLKGKSELRDIPVIAMTAQVMKGDREKILAAGCDDYIAKPIDPESTTKKISEWLKG